MYPNYSDTSIQRLQRIQNRALRLALGCHTTASVSHVHAEAKELLVKDHLELLSAQFLARCLKPSHASYEVATRDVGRRQMKETLRSKVLHRVQPYLDQNGEVAPGTYGDTIKAIHTDIVREAIQRQDPNRVLNASAPAISWTEKSLQRQTRTALTQLRSGFCAKLKDYQFRIGKAQDDLCPDCFIDPQTASHIFECPARRTQLVVEDLWRFPTDVASFLSSHPSFDVPPPPPPPARRRRGRPPPDPPPSPAPAFNYTLFSPLSIPSFSLDFSSSHLSSISSSSLDSTQ